MLIHFWVYLYLVWNNSCFLVGMILWFMFFFIEAINCLHFYMG
ncbi:hypothetical protein Hanom_Chr09g00802271 [Helianthus anomalus]